MGGRVLLGLDGFVGGPKGETPRKPVASFDICSSYLSAMPPQPRFGELQPCPEEF